MTKLLKKSGALALTFIVCFTMLFADVGIASAASTTTSLGQRGNVKEIKYIYPSSLTYEENTNGQWSIDENGEFFYRYNMNSDCEPEVFTVEYESGEEVTYSRYSGAGDAYWSRSQYKSSTGEKITLTNCVKSNQPEKHFKVGKDNYFTFTFKGATKKIPVGITASTVITTVQSIKYIPKTIEYDYSDAELVYNGAKNEGQWCFPFAYHHHSGDKLVVTDAAGNEKTYTYQDGYIATVENGTEWVDAKFISTDGNEINPELVSIYNDQDLYEWGYGRDCYILVEYDGAVTKVPVTVKKNDVESISIYVGEDSEEPCLSCDAENNGEENFYIMECLDGIIVHKQDGSTETIKYYDSKYDNDGFETNGYFDNNDNLIGSITICHKNFADSGQWYVYYHGVSCPIKTSHDNTSWEVKTKPTCKKTGLYEKACICGEVVDTAVIPVDENAHKFTSYVYNNDAKVGVDGTETASCDYGCGKTDTRTKAGTALKNTAIGGSGFVLPTVSETTDVETDKATSTTTSKTDVKVNKSTNADGTTEISAADGDTINITIAKSNKKTEVEIKEYVQSGAAAASMKTRSSKTSNGKIKVVLKTDEETASFMKDMEELGYTLKYRFYRSTKKSSGYKSMKTKTTSTYTNTSGKAGTRYYYKVQIRIYDADGKLAAKTALKQCKYATRIFG